MTVCLSLPLYADTQISSQIVVAFQPNIALIYSSFEVVCLPTNCKLMGPSFGPASRRSWSIVTCSEHSVPRASPARLLRGEPAVSPLLVLPSPSLIVPLGFIMVLPLRTVFLSGGDLAPKRQLVMFETFLGVTLEVGECY